MQDVEKQVKIQQILADLRPYIESHRGSIEFVELKENVVFVRLAGACLECPLSFYTLTLGLERHIKQAIPSIISVQTIDEI